MNFNDREWLQTLKKRNVARDTAVFAIGSAIQTAKKALGDLDADIISAIEHKLHELTERACDADADIEYLKKNVER